MFASPVLAQTKLDPFGASTRPDAAPKSPGMISSVEFVDAPVNTIFKMISDLTGWSIILSPEVTRQPPKINIWIKNLSPTEVLDQVCRLANLTLERKGNVIQVMTFDEYASLTGLEKRVIAMKHASAKDVAALARPFCDKSDQARVVSDDAANRVILLMPKQKLDSIERLIQTLDTPFESESLRVVPLKFLDGSKIMPALEQFLAKSSAPAPAVRRTAATQDAPDASSPGDRWNVQFMFEPSLNVIVLRGAPASITRTAELIAQLDVRPDLQVVCHELKYTSAREAFTTLNDVVQKSTSSYGYGGYGGYSSPGSPAAVSRVRIALSESNNRIVVEGGQEELDRIARIIQAVDKPTPPGTGGSRVYRLENASSTEVAKVIEGLLADSGNGGGYSSSVRQPIRSMGSPGNPSSPRAADRGVSTPMPLPVPPGNGSTPRPAGGDNESAGIDLLPSRVIDAPEINAVIIRASAAEHDELAQIIKELDRPRSQVVLEVTLVTVRSDRTFDLGLELEGSVGGGPKMTAFSTFGIGKADSKDSTLRLSNPPRFGANVAVFDSDDYSLIIHALQTVGEVRISSAPKVLVQDNSKAVISAINQEPYETVSQGDTSTISTFGGFVDAGTQLMVVPHISQQSWLRLDYQIDQSSFGTRTVSQEAANLPPPRRQTTLGGTVRIPSENMIVLGGIVGTRADTAVEQVPLLGDIPCLGELFKRTSKSSMNETLFVFIRPLVLRDPELKDLMHLSRADILRAKVDPGNLELKNPMKLLGQPPEVNE